MRELIETIIRRSISEEQEAISAYLERIHLCNELMENKSLENVKIQTLKETLEDIVEEEKIHVGQLREMLNVVGIQQNKENDGVKEAKLTFIRVANRLRPYMKEE